MSGPAWSTDDAQRRPPDLRLVGPDAALPPLPAPERRPAGSGILLSFWLGVAFGAFVTGVWAVLAIGAILGAR